MFQTLCEVLEKTVRDKTLYSNGVITFSHITRKETIKIQAPELFSKPVELESLGIEPRDLLKQAFQVNASKI